MVKEKVSSVVSRALKSTAHHFPPEVLRMPKESDRAWHAFQIWCTSAPRQFSLMERTTGIPIRTIKTYFAKHSWSRRAAAYDDCLARAMVRSAEVVAADRAAEYARRRTAAEDEAHDLKEQLLAKVRQMIAWPLQRVVRDEDGQTIHIHPAKWTFATVPQMVNVLTSLWTISSGLAPVSGMDSDIVARLLQAVRDVVNRHLPEEQQAAFAEDLQRAAQTVLIAEHNITAATVGGSRPLDPLTGEEAWKARKEEERGESA